MGPSRCRYVFGAFQLDPVDKMLMHHGHPVPLTPKAFDTLVVLVERHGHLVAKDELLRLVWPNTFVEENNLAQNISALRRALGEGTTGDRFIDTVPKRGYRFVAAVTVQPLVDPPGAVAPAAEGQTASLIAASQPETGQTSAPAGRRRALWAFAGAAVLGVAVALPTFRDRATGARADVRQAAPPPADAVATPAVARIAVLPFVNLGDPADASFVTGVAEELISRLASLRHVAVPSSTTLAAYDRRGKTLAQIGADLRVDYAVEGSVRWTRVGDVVHVRMTPRLVRVADDTTVWTQQLDAPLSDLFKVQAEIAHQITDALQVALDNRERQAVVARASGDAEAYLAYLRGMALYQMGTSDTANLAAARVELEQAVARDPAFASAWSWLARVYAAQYRSGAVRTPAIMTTGLRAAETAIALDPTRTDLRLGRIDMLMSARDLEAAQRELAIARAGLPNSSQILGRSAVIAQIHGRWREAQTDLLHAFELDPASTAESLAIHYLHLRQYDEARRFISVARAANQTGVTVPEAWTHVSERGDVAAARRVLDAALRARPRTDSRVLGLLARVEWFDGHPQRALDLIGEMDAAGAWLAPNFRFPAALAAAQVYESMGRHADATRHYADAYAQVLRGLRGRPPDHKQEISLALAAAGLGRAEAAAAHVRRVRELIPVSQDAAEGPLGLYLTAQVYARLGDHAAAFATLDQLFSVPGFYSDQWVRLEPVFAAIRQRPEFPAAIERWARQRGAVLLEPRAAPEPGGAVSAGR